MAKKKRNPQDEPTLSDEGEAVNVNTEPEGVPQADEPDVDTQFDSKTQRMAAPSLSVKEDDDNRTHIIGASRRRRRDARKRLRTEVPDAMDDPPAGWLVIVDGPGKGNVLTIGYGMNSIGRDQGERISVAFGDDRISRQSHAKVTYDARGRKFYVQHGGGANLVYLNDEVVLSPTEIPELGHLNIGDTTLRFVPLCGASFDWQALPQIQAQ